MYEISKYYYYEKIYKIFLGIICLVACNVQCVQSKNEQHVSFVKTIIIYTFYMDLKTPFIKSQFLLQIQQSVLYNLFSSVLFIYFFIYFIFSFQNFGANKVTKSFYSPTPQSARSLGVTSYTFFVLNVSD